MRKIFYSLCIFLGVVFTAIVLHKVISICYWSKVGDNKEAFAQNLFDKDNKELDLFLQNSKKAFDLYLENSKSATSDFLKASKKIDSEEVSKEELYALLKFYKDAIFKGENNVGIKKLYFDFLDKLSKNKNEFTLVFAKEFGSEDLISENANALSVNMDFYLFDFYNVASYEDLMQVIATTFINSMNEKLGDKGIKFFVKNKNLITAEGKIYNCIGCTVSFSQKKSDMQNFATVLAYVTEESLQKSKSEFCKDVKNNLSQKLFKLHEKAYKRIIGIYLK